VEPLPDVRVVAGHNHHRLLPWDPFADVLLVLPPGYIIDKHVKVGDLYNRYPVMYLFIPYRYLTVFMIILHQGLQEHCRI
jgi:hypothetical protein